MGAVAVKYAEGKQAWGLCDRCGQRFKLKDLKRIMIKNTLTQILVCKSDWEPSHPQLRLGERPVYDPQGLRNPRPDLGRYEAGVNVYGYPSSGYRIFQWGFSPVGGASQFDTVLTPNALISVGSVASVLAG